MYSNVIETKHVLADADVLINKTAVLYPTILLG